MVNSRRSVLKPIDFVRTNVYNRGFLAQFWSPDKLFIFKRYTCHKSPYSSSLFPAHLHPHTRTHPQQQRLLSIQTVLCGSICRLTKREVPSYERTNERTNASAPLVRCNSRGRDNIAVAVLFRDREVGFVDDAKEVEEAAAETETRTALWTFD